MWYLKRGVILTKDNLARRNWHGDKTCSICHSLETIQHPLFKYHMKIFILIGNLICQISCDTRTPLLINAAYMDLTVNEPEACKPQTKTSLCSSRFNSCIEATILSQARWFAPTKFLRKEIFSGFDSNTFATESCCLLTILNNAGNLSFNGLSPSQVSYQNLV